jgi:hypothetical protein
MQCSIHSMPGNDEFTPAFFDTATAAWLQNKKRAGHSYVYVCAHITRKGTRCKKTCHRESDKCWYHASQ